MYCKVLALRINGAYKNTCLRSTDGRRILYIDEYVRTFNPKLVKRLNILNSIRLDAVEIHCVKELEYIEKYIESIIKIERNNAIHELLKPVQNYFD
jgi:hypothetical protein